MLPIAFLLFSYLAILAKRGLLIIDGGLDGLVEIGWRLNLLK